jgi:hypothetical protein
MRLFRGGGLTALKTQPIQFNEKKMSIKKEIFENFLLKLENEKEIPKELVPKLRQLIESRDIISEANILKLINEVTKEQNDQH